jgi:hypothetical protein
MARGKAGQGRSHGTGGWKRLGITFHRVI